MLPAGCVPEATQPLARPARRKPSGKHQPKEKFFCGGWNCSENSGRRARRSRCTSRSRRREYHAYYPIDPKLRTASVPGLPSFERGGTFARVVRDVYVCDHSISLLRRRNHSTPPGREATRPRRAQDSGQQPSSVARLSEWSAAA